MGPGERNGQSISQINVTPLVDVMLVLLVIFMVTAPILRQGVTVDLPQVRAGGLEGEDLPLVVSLTARGELYLNDTRVTEEGLLEKLRAIVREQPARQVFLRADGRVPYGKVMRIMAAVKEVGVDRLGMVTQPPVAEP